MTQELFQALEQAYALVFNTSRLDVQAKLCGPTLCGIAVQACGLTYNAVGSKYLGESGRNLVIMTPMPRRLSEEEKNNHAGSETTPYIRTQIGHESSTREKKKKS